MVIPHTASEGAITTQTSQDLAALPERTNRTLLNIVRDNLNTQYALQSSSLAELRDAVSVHPASTEIDDVTLLLAFRNHVPLSTYDSYKSFIDRFNARPCKREDVENLLSPGLPDFFALSSATSGTMPKVLPKYDHDARLKRPTRLFFDPKSTLPLAGVVCTRYSEVKEVEDATGDVVQRIPVCVVTGGGARRTMGWYTDEEDHMTAPSYAVPWAATVIGYLPSLLIIHGLFFLARRDVARFYTPFATVFIDLIRHIDEKWDLLLSCIKNGTVPDVEGIDHVRKHLQTCFVADPERAAELLEIGPPFSCEGWVSRVWTNATSLTTIFTGTFATVVPKVRYILGPDVALIGAGYGASEALVGRPHDADKPDEFVLRSDDFVEFLDITQEEETHAHLCQSWEVQQGKQYEPILTTRDGLWRYRIGDVLFIVGFDVETNAPVFKYMGRRSLTIRFPHTQITDDQLVTAVLAFSSADTIQAHEFTTMVDDRAFPSTVGFFFELAGPLGSKAGQAAQLLFEALVATNSAHRRAHENGQMRFPTVRIVEAGTFAEYRRWKAESANVAPGQIKVPVVLMQSPAQEWISGRVVMEI